MNRPRTGVLAAVLAVAGSGLSFGQDALTIRVQVSLFQTCGDLTVRIENVTNPLDTKQVTMGCDPSQLYGRGEDAQRQTIAVHRILEIPPQHLSIPRAQRVAIDANWLGANDWQLSSTAEWITLRNVALPIQVYKINANFQRRFDVSAEEKLLEQTLVVSTSGPSVRQIVIRRKTISEVLADKFIAPQTLYVSIIAILLGAVLAGLRKRAEKLIDSALDYLGSFGMGKLAVRRFLKRYADYLLSTHRYLRLLGFAAAGVSRPQLQQVFISVRVSPFDRKGGTANRDADADTSFEKAVAQFPHLVVLGGPGAGKTTTLSYIALQLIKGRHSELLGAAAPILPIFVPLRRLSNRDTSLVDDILSPDTQILPADILRECPNGYMQRQLERGRCILLLDGLDEVIDEGTHRLAAQKINRLVTDFPRNRFIVTCRIAGWQGLLDDFRVLEAEDLNRREVRRFVFGWHRAVITQEYQNQIELKFQGVDERKAAWEKESPDLKNAIDSTSRRLTNAIEGSPRLMAVATNPMLLSLICLVHYVKNILPRERPILYERCIELLIDAWDRGRNIIPATTINTSEKEAVLRAAAFAFQISGKGEAPRPQVEQIISAAITERNSSGGTYRGSREAAC